MFWNAQFQGTRSDTLTIIVCRHALPFRLKNIHEENDHRPVVYEVHSLLH